MNKTTLRIEQADPSRAEPLTRLVLALWPDHAYNEMAAEIATLLATADAAFFLAYLDGQTVGFAQCQLRHDYVEGTATSPVGYLEGIYVVPECREQGIARQLLSACEAWAKGLGCREFASDCELANLQSLAFHQSMGFSEANRIICFTKPLV